MENKLVNKAKVMNCLINVSINGVVHTPLVAEGTTFFPVPGVAFGVPVVPGVLRPEREGVFTGVDLAEELVESFEGVRSPELLEEEDKDFLEAAGEIRPLEAGEIRPLEAGETGPLEAEAGAVVGLLREEAVGKCVFLHYEW